MNHIRMYYQRYMNGNHCKCQPDNIIQFIENLEKNKSIHPNYHNGYYILLNDILHYKGNIINNDDNDELVSVNLENFNFRYIGDNEYHLRDILCYCLTGSFPISNYSYKDFLDSIRRRVKNNDIGVILRLESYELFEWFSN